MYKPLPPPPHPKILTSQKLSDPLGFSGFISFHRLVSLGGYIQYPEDGVYSLSCVLFGHKALESSSLENLYKKVYRTWPKAVKAFIKHPNAPAVTNKKNQILLARFPDEYRGKATAINKVFHSTHKESI